MNFTLYTTAFCLSSFFMSAQSTSSVWQKSNEAAIEVTGKRDIIPNSYKTYHLELNKLKQLLNNAPLEKNVSTQHSNSIIELPLPDGSVQNFKVVECPVMEELLQASYPNIKTYTIKGIDDVYATGKLDVTEFGFHGMIRSPQGDVFIDPYCKWNTSDYISYYIKDFVKPSADMLPEVGILDAQPSTKKSAGISSQICAGQNLRTYRLAVGCTAQYAIAATGQSVPTIAQTLAKVVTTVNRVDGVYEKEVAIHLVLVNTTTLTLFTNTSTQPYTGNLNAGTLIGESQSVITNTIGSANFDIGHTFSTGGGGLASLGCVCDNSRKAAGITGNANPVGDPFDIDYVAHEIGHQFSGNHTFRANTGSCAGNGNYGNFFASTAAEPGSGVSIMGYAGICGANDNLTGNSIPYFHAVSFDEIMDFTTNNGGGSCPIITATGNNPPVVTASNNYTIPSGTPFTLTGSATDPDGDALTYQWEETDAATTAGTWNDGIKPFFRSYTPVTTPTRLCPSLATVNSGNMQSTRGEYLPTTPQVLNFRLTARDNKTAGGGVCYASSQITLVGNSSFSVSSQNTTGIVYPNGSTQLITWDVANTTASPINCSNVTISVSTDNGTTFTVVLANTPNDGSENVVLPTVPGYKPLCRVKVESVGNIFFDINNKFFAISNVTGLNQYVNSDAFKLQVSPNPFTDNITIGIEAINGIDVSKTTLTIYDILGNSVKTETLKLSDNFTKTYNLSDLANGSYIIEVSDGKQKSIARLMKI